MISQKGWLKGIVAVSNRFSVPKGAVLQASNLLLSERGALQTCDGSLSQSNLTGAPGAFYELGFFVDSSLVVTKLALARVDATHLRLYNWNTNPPTALTGGGGQPADILVTSGWLHPQIFEFSGFSIITLGNGQTPVTVTISGGVAAITTLSANTSGAWLANHYYSIGDRVSNSGNAYQIVSLTITGTNAQGSIGNGGFSGSTTPAFAAADQAGTTIKDNQLIWMCIRNTGAELAKQSVPVGAAHGINHAGALWLWNTSPTNTDPTANGVSDGPSVLRQSGVNDPNAWPNANVAYVGKDDGTQGTGIATFTIAEAGIAPLATLVLFKDFSTYQVNGLFQGTNFQIQQVKTDMGCIAGRTPLFATGIGIIRLSHLGFAAFNGVTDQVLSEQIRPYIFGRADITGIDFSNAIFARAALVANPPMYICAVPTLDTFRYRIFCFDLVMNAWAIIDYFNGGAGAPLVNSMRQLRPPGGPAVTYVGDSVGTTSTIRRIQQGDTNWDGTAINYSFTPPEVGDPGSRAYFRRAQVRLHAATAGSMTAAISVASQAEPNATKTEASAGPSSGPPALSAATYNGESDLAVPFDIGMTGPSARGKFSGSGKVTIEAVDWHVTPKPARAFSGMI